MLKELLTDYPARDLAEDIGAMLGLLFIWTQASIWLPIIFR